MTTEQAFEKLISTKCWFRLVGVTSLQATTIKREYKQKNLRLDSMVKYLQTTGGIMELSIISPIGEVIDSYEEAFEELLNTPDIHETLKLRKHYFYKFKWRFFKDGFTKSTMHKYLEKAGYTIEVDWELPPEIR